MSDQPVTVEELDPDAAAAILDRLLRGRIAGEIEAAAHPCQEDDVAYCACADLQRKQDARIARGER